MEIHIYSVKVKNQGGNDNTKNPKPQDTQLKILKIDAFFTKNQQRTSDPGQSAGRVL